MVLIASSGWRNLTTSTPFNVDFMWLMHFCATLPIFQITLLPD